jgi:OmcA/MtrC family decaheme c-type cytochrome
VIVGRYTGSGRAGLLAAVGLCLAAAACQQPVVGAKALGAAPSEGPRIVIEDAFVDLHGHVVTTFSVSQDEVPLSLAEVNGLSPRFTVATLSAHPVDGLRAWKSQLLTGSQTAPSLPPSGPGTPPGLVITGARQPGSETPATLVDLGDGRYRYVFLNALAAFDPDETVRVGVWLGGAASPSLNTSSTYDFRPSGGPMEERETVLDENCDGCHGLLAHHGNRVGSRICLTCHTWQNTDPDTVDPAALATATASTDPNPLEFGRMVHRIHRGNELPTLFQSSTSANPAPGLPSLVDLPTPFTPEANTTAILGSKYSIVGYRGSQLVPGQVVQKTDNAQPAKTIVVGITFPRDLRDCGVCHGGARQGYEVQKAISRRTCAGCHPDVWFQDTPSTLDPSHFAHAGGPRSDDASCASCHVEAPAGVTLYAPIGLIHVPLPQGVRYGALTFTIVKVENLRPGSAPRVTYRLADRYGPIAPKPNAPVPTFEPATSPTASFNTRAFLSPNGSLTIRIAGPIAPDYGGTGWTSLSSGASQISGDPLNLSTGAFTDEYVYTFSTISPSAPQGTWAVGMEGRRRPATAWKHYDTATDTFRWPYTGQRVVESPDNPIVYVDTATGSWPPDAPSQRRTIVADATCLRCHGRFEMHSGSRHQVQYCHFCHTPLFTDYGGRKKTAAGFVDLNASFDGIEERSIHLKVMVHRIHTGGRTGAASLEAIEPFVISGIYFDDGLFPNDLRNCTVCHLGKSYLVEAVPAKAGWTVANETATIRHAANTSTHSSGEPSSPPIQAACLGCHATGPTIAHAQATTVSGAETCAQCHSKGNVGVDVAHGLAAPSGTTAASFSAIRDQILVPRCASTACHGAGSAQLPHLDAASAYGGLVNAQSGQASLVFVKPSAAEASYLVYKLRGSQVSVGGSGAIMPTDGALAPADIAAIEAWIANGAPND